MNKKTIWKSYDLYTSQEEKDLMEILREYYPDATDDDAYEMVNEYFEADFGEKGNLSYSSLKNSKCVVKGVLGLWNGKHTICPKQFDSIEQAVYACLEDSNEIYEDRYGNLCISAYHHDGVNNFVIKLLTDKGERCVRFCERV